MKLQEKKNRFSTAIILNSSILLILFFSNVFSAPLRNFPQTLIQPNGDTLYCFASGDEFHNWLHDAEGYTIIQHPETGFYTYAIKVNGELSASSYIVGEVDPQKVGLEKRLNISPNLIKQKRETFLKTSPPMGLAPRVGTINNIVVFIRFSDESEFTDQRSTYDNMFNSSVSGNNSMYNYYREATYNNLTIISTSYPTTGGSTVVSYQDAQSRNYYSPYNAVTNPIGYQGGDNGIQRRDREHILLRNAINVINSQVSSSLNLDEDNDDLVDNVCFIVYGSLRRDGLHYYGHIGGRYTLRQHI